MINKEVKKYRYRKITPEDIIKMKKLREEGFTYKVIGKIFDVGGSIVNYHINPKENARQKAYAKAYSKKHPEKIYQNKKGRTIYIRKYIKDRYNNDEEFRLRFLEHVKRSQKKIRRKNKAAGLCAQCGSKREGKFLTCGRCREQKRNQVSYKKRLKK